METFVMQKGDVDFPAVYRICSEKGYEKGSFQGLKSPLLWVASDEDNLCLVRTDAHMMQITVLEECVLEPGTILEIVKVTKQIIIFAAIETETKPPNYSRVIPKKTEKWFDWCSDVSLGSYILSKCGVPCQMKYLMGIPVPSRVYIPEDNAEPILVEEPDYVTTVIMPLLTVGSTEWIANRSHGIEEFFE